MAENRETTGRHLKRLYRNRDGEITKQLSENVEQVLIETIVGGHRVEADMRKLFVTFPEPCMGLAAAAFGLNTVLGNAVAGKEKDNPAAVSELIASRWESILDGEWSEGRQGPTMNAVLDAWAEDATNRGHVVTAESRAKMKAKILAGGVTTKDLLDNPAIQVCYQQAIVRKQQQKLAEVQAKVSNAGDNVKVFDPE